MRGQALWMLLGVGIIAAGIILLGRRRRPVEPRPVPAAAPYDLTAAPSWRTELPAELAEISGIAFTPDGRLFAHGDEEATLWELDLRSGQPRKHFSVAAAVDQASEKRNNDAPAGIVNGDFEDLAIVGERFFLITSAGRLYEFQEGGDGERVPHTVVRTGLDGRCELEGMSYEAKSSGLLLLCKQNLPKKSAPEQILIYSWSIDDEHLSPEPRVQVEYPTFGGDGGSKRFNGSAMAFVPGTETLMLVAGPQRAFAEITTDGAIATAGSLDPTLHRQPEGLAFSPDGTLLIADEAVGGEATLTGYAPGRGCCR